MDEPTLTRTFEAELAAGDGRTIEARIVPYNTPATVSDPPDFRPYREMFLPGAFERQVNAAHRVPVWLNFEHEQGLRGLVGYGTELHDRPDALYGTFRVQPNTDGDKALDLVNAGQLTGVSMEFASRHKRTVHGVVERIQAHLDKVSLCRTPAYDDARVVAVRQRPMRRPLPKPPAFDKTLAVRLGRLGVQVPEMLLVERMDTEDLACLAQMIQLGTCYIQEQDEPDDQKNIPVMENILELLSILVPVEVAETEPFDEPEDEE